MCLPSQPPPWGEGLRNTPKPESSAPPPSHTGDILARHQGWPLARPGGLHAEVGPAGASLETPWSTGISRGLGTFQAPLDEPASALVPRGLPGCMWRLESRARTSRCLVAKPSGGLCPPQEVQQPEHATSSGCLQGAPSQGHAATPGKVRCFGNRAPALAALGPNRLGGGGGSGWDAEQRPMGPCQGLNPRGRDGLQREAGC